MGRIEHLGLKDQDQIILNSAGAGRLMPHPGGRSCRLPDDGGTNRYVEDHLQMPDVPGGTGIDDVRTTFGRTSIDLVIMGGGIDLETRLEIVREIFHLSETTSVHMKDVASGPQGFLPFVRSILGDAQGGAVQQ